MRLDISPRERRTLVVGAATVTALLGLGKGVPAWRRWDGLTRAAARETMAEAARARASVERLGVVRESLDARSARYRALTSRFVAGETPATAAGALASVITEWAARSGLTLGAVSVRVDSAAGAPPRSSRGPSLARISVSGDAVGDLAGVTTFLGDLEQGPLLLAVRELALTQPDPAAPGDRPEMLRVEFVIEGLTLAGATAAGAAAAGGGVGEPRSQAVGEELSPSGTASDGGVP